MIWPRLRIREVRARWRAGRGLAASVVIYDEEGVPAGSAPVRMFLGGDWALRGTARVTAPRRVRLVRAALLRPSDGVVVKEWGLTLEMRRGDVLEVEAALFLDPDEMARSRWPRR